MSQHHEQQQERSRLKNQTKALYQAQRHANPVVRSLERSSDTGQRCIAREVLGVQEQEQSANTQQQAVAREEPGVQEQRQEQEQPVDTVRQAVARLDPEVREQRPSVARNQCQNIYPKYMARLSDLLLLNQVIKRIVHNDAWYLPENPEFEYGCLINIIPRGWQ